MLSVKTIKKPKFTLIQATLLGLCMGLLNSSHADIFFSSRTIGPSTNIYAVSEEGKLKKITDDTKWRDTDADINDKGDIVFMSNRKDIVKIDLKKNSEVFNIFEYSKNKKKITQVTKNTHLDYSPVYSPDGKWLAYIEKKDKLRHLMLMQRKDNSNKSIASASNISNISWSSDSASLAFVGDDKNTSTIQTVNIKSTKKKVILRVWADRERKKETKGSPLETALIKPGYSLMSKRIVAAQFSPDNKKIAYILTSTVEQNLRQLRVLDLKHISDRTISNRNIQVQFPVQWSADNTQLLYSALADYQYHFDEKTQQKVYKGGMHIYLSSLDGKTSQLSSGDHLHNRPVFSPNGKQVAYLYGETLGDRELALNTLDLKTRKKRQLYDKVSGDSFLFWQ